MNSKIVTQFNINDTEFDLLRKLIKEVSGINLSNQKKMLVVARLSKRLRALGMSSFTKYYNYVTKDPAGRQELNHLVNRITTNKTDFYRESHHFEFLQDVLLPQLYEEGIRSSNRRLRIWSAGCSSGEEPYTIAITLKEFFKGKLGWDIKVLATDLDTEMLDKAKKGIYDEQAVAPIPPEYLRDYFMRGTGANSGLYKVKDSLKDIIAFRKHNMVSDDLPAKNPFDIIFCRNVIIYFDEETKEKVINRFYDCLRSNGYLFLGHSESLIGCESQFKLVGNSICLKVD
ncbi:MAG: protein-glutamate O-methyltransferase [Firmicutes bacterium]|nr:protein-glutamate O-methyltransferase [Bacillota bacterium]